jgi:hypothetical protein
VLFNEVRDANPFFHLFEALWILAGRRDVAFLKKFNKNMEQFGSGENFHAAYGYRLQGNGFSQDQLELAISMLKYEPTTRRVAAQIWDQHLDLGVQNPDIPCNMILTFKIRSGRLNMTVFCRSNDMIWGAYGANAVQFSMIQQYVAAGVGVEVGEYTQISDSFHVYTENTQGQKQKEMWEALMLQANTRTNPSCLYSQGIVAPFQLVQNHEQFSLEVRDFCDLVLDANQDLAWQMSWEEPFLAHIACPMLRLWQLHQEYRAGAEKAIPRWVREYPQLINRADWLYAGRQWVERKENKNEAQ